MTIVNEDGCELVIVMYETSPEEMRVKYIRSIAPHLAHYALNPDKRKTDHEDAAVLSDLLQELSQVKKPSCANSYGRQIR